MKPEQQRVLNENTLTLMERLMRRIETSEVRVTDVGMKTGSFAYGSVDAPQWGNDGTFVLTIATIDDSIHEEAMLLRTDDVPYVPEPGAYDEDLPDTDAEPVDHMARLKAEELAKVVKTLRDHATKLEDGTLTLDGFSLVKPAELVEVEGVAGLVRTFAGTGNLALAYHDASARAAHLAHAEVVVD